MQIFCSNKIQKHKKAALLILVTRKILDAIEFLLDKLRQTKSNSDFFDSMNA